MSQRDPAEPTIRFSLWPYLILLEGSSSSIAALIDVLYDDPQMSRDAWSIHHPFESRRLFAEELRKEGDTARRLGIGSRSQEAVEIVRHHASNHGVEAHVMSTATTGTERDWSGAAPEGLT